MICSIHFRTTGLSVNSGLLERGMSTARDEIVCWGARILEQRAYGTGLAHQKDQVAQQVAMGSTCDETATSRSLQFL
tara:strand:- start:2074 stop:2304 length:231 start_codon:yes stop_codon:yes gene_type:complete